MRTVIFKIISTVICAPIFVLIMLAVNWMLVPQIINLFVKVNFFGPFAYKNATSLQLILDLVISFVFAFIFMIIANRVKIIYGVAAIIFMAFCGWGVYFIEVGFFKGMIKSIYPIWYEIISFIKYPLAAFLVICLNCIKQQNKNNQTITAK